MKRPNSLKSRRKSALDIIEDKNLIVRNLNYYAERIDENGPNMAFPMYAGAAAKAGDAASRGSIPKGHCYLTRKARSESFRFVKKVRPRTLERRRVACCRPLSWDLAVSFHRKGYRAAKPGTSGRMAVFNAQRHRREIPVEVKNDD